MGLEIVDYISTNGKSPIHSSNTIYKALFTIVNITLLIATKSYYYPFIILTLLFIIMITNKVPIFKVLPFLFYPFFFSGLFVLGMGHDFQTSLWFITKTVAIAASMLLLVTTTPIYSLFSLLRRVFPCFLIDGLHFTYRSFFIFHTLVSNLILTLKLKGGYGRLSFITNIKNVGGAVAITFIRAIDSAERMKEIFHIRGYEIGNIRLQKEKRTIWNLYPVFLGVFTIFLFLWI